MGSFKTAISASAARPEATARFTLDTILVNSDKSPVLIIKHAGEKNRAYRDAVFKIARSRQARSGGAAAVTAQSVRADRELEAQMFAKHVIVGWENVCETRTVPSETPGAPPETRNVPADPTPAKFEEFLIALIDDREDIFVGLTAYARDQENFRDAATESGVELGKSSASG